MATLQEESQIQQFFAGASVFVTGGTGFLGKLLIEKLLRSCKDINRIYVLIRDKKGKSGEKRYEEILESVLFQQLKLEQPNFTKKITLINGDCLLPDLGLNQIDKQIIIDEVNCVFHCAATVRFDEKVRTATYINVRATRDALTLAKQMKQLKSFVHISSIVAKCVAEEINEDLCNPPITAEKLLEVVDMLSDELLEDMKPKLIKAWPNTYAFTKAVAEEAVISYGKQLPIAIVRPSAVISTSKEPVEGWIDNVYGPTGVAAGAGVGLIHTVKCKLDGFAEVVPADLLTNCTIAAAWDAGSKISKDQHIKDNKVQIYNYVSSTEKPLKWQDYMMYTEKYGKMMPPVLMVWYPFVIINSSYFMHLVCLLFLHTIPAYIGDFIALCLGRKRMLVKGYQKINKFLKVLAAFNCHDWRFTNNNTQALWKKLNMEDRKIFNFDICSLNWDRYFEAYVRGGRIYLLKDPLDTIPQARAKYFRFKVLHYTVVSLLVIGLYKLLLIPLKAIF